MFHLFGHMLGVHFGRIYNIQKEQTVFIQFRRHTAFRFCGNRQVISWASSITCTLLICPSAPLELQKSLSPNGSICFTRECHFRRVRLQTQSDLTEIQIGKHSVCATLQIFEKIQCWLQRLCGRLKRTSIWLWLQSIWRSLWSCCRMVWD